MTDTSDLIAQLSAAAKPAKSPLKPRVLVAQLLALLLAYGIGAQFYLGLRPDIFERLTSFWFEAEIVSLWFLILTSVLAGVVAMAPDAYQKPALLKLPYVVFGVLVLILVWQLFTSTTLPSLEELKKLEGMECAICIASITMVPSALMFAVLKRGASIHPLQAGSFAVFAAAGIGCLTLRLAEPTDSIMHLVQWHYLPTLLFAMLGAALGKWLLKW